MIISTTSERSGYPKDVKGALIGFETYEEAETLAKKYGLQISSFYKKDGWQLWYRNGAADSALEYRVEDFGEDYEFINKNSIGLLLDKMRDSLESCTTWEEAREIYESSEKIQEDMDDLSEDEVLVVEGLDIIDTVHLKTMKKDIDSQYWVVGVETI